MEEPNGLDASVIDYINLTLVLKSDIIFISYLHNFQEVLYAFRKRTFKV